MESSLKTSNGSIGIFASIAYAIGSIIGSGILFLPTLTVVIAKNDAILSWVLGSILCIPILYIFKDIITFAPNTTSIDDFVVAIWGEGARSLIPFLFISTVCLGMPAAALIVGDYVKVVIETPHIELIVASVLILIGWLANIYNVGVNASINNILVILFVLAAIFLILLTGKDHADQLATIKPEFEISSILSGALVTFWAFAGFENLTFISKNFSGGSKDFLRASAAALVICGLLYLLLTISIILITNSNDNYSLTRNSGLMVLIQNSAQLLKLKYTLVIFAFMAVLINQVSWVKGISRMIAKNAANRVFPLFLSKNDPSGEPKVAVLVFSMILLLSSFIQYYLPGARDFSIAAVSLNFIIIYIVCLVSFLFTKARVLKKVFALSIIMLLTAIALTSGYTLAYPTAVFVLSLLLSKKFQYGVQ